MDFTPFFMKNPDAKCMRRGIFAVTESDFGNAV